MSKTEPTAFSMSLATTYWFIGPALLSEDLSLVDSESVGGGRFELELDPKDDGSGFEVSLSNVVALVPNPTFERSKIWLVTFLRIAIRRSMPTI